MEFSNLRVYQPDGTFKTGGLSISDDRIASAEVSADAVDMGGLYAVPGLGRSALSRLHGPRFLRRHA